MESSAAIAAYNDPKGYEILIMQGGDQGVGPFHSADLLQLQADRAGRWLFKYLFAELRHRRCVRRPASQGGPTAKQKEDLQAVSSKLTNNAIDKTASWYHQALSSKSKCLQGLDDPAEHAGFITGVQNWYFTSSGPAS